MSPNRWLAAFAVAPFLLITAAVQAQWVLAARAARNEINRMTQRSDSGGYDIATVVLDADPSKVYDKTIELLKTHPELKITREDKRTGTIEFQKGKKVAGFQIYALGDKVTQMVIASGVSKSKKTDETSMVVESIMHVCAEFNVSCAVQPH